MKNHDMREQLYNERKIGSLGETQLPLERIVQHHGILFDLDPCLYRPGNTIFPPDDDPKAFFEKIKPVLDRHPLARFSEVRVTGTGLHAIVRLDPPAELKSAVDQHHWDTVVRAVQCTLPGDLNAPGITALTRAVGSVNSKNGAVVEVLRPGEPVSPKAVEEFVAQVARASFKEIALVVLGGQRVQPCPVCAGEGSYLDVLDHVGMCYGSCGKVSLGQLLDCVYAPPEAEKKPGHGKKNNESASPVAVRKPRARRTKASKGTTEPNKRGKRAARKRPATKTIALENAKMPGRKKPSATKTKSD